MPPGGGMPGRTDASSVHYEWKLATSETAMDARYLGLIKRFEGYQAQAKWDYAQFTNGYGTKAAHAGEVIDRAEAERRFDDELSKAAAVVDRFAPGLDGGTRAALTSLTFNAGTRWMQSGLGAAVRSGDLDQARDIFVQYTKAGGEELSGLVKRRLEEVTWFEDGQGAVADATVASALRFAGVTLGSRSVEPSEPRTTVEAKGTGAVAGARDVVRFFEQFEIEQLRLLLLRPDLIRTVESPDRDQQV